MAEWIKRFFEDLWLPRRESRQAEAKFIRQVLRLRKGQQVLDAPCGDGEVALHLARLGIHVTGVDITPKFIARARRKFRKEALPGEFRVMDLREVDYESQFDAAYNWYGSFGYFSDAENLDVLRRFARALRPGGRLLIEQLNREYALRHFRHQHQVRDVRMTSKWHPKPQRVVTVYTRLGGGKRETCRSSMRLYTPGEFTRLFARCGLEVIKIYGGWEGAAYRRGARRLVIIGRKKRLRKCAQVNLA
jgi:SAM-dependent methyltransferase